MGAGYLGYYHALKYKEMPDVELVAVVDVNEQRARTLAAQVRAVALGDHRSLVGMVDLATVAVPTRQHFSVVKTLLEAGIHILVEKPIASSLEEAEEMVYLANSKGLVLQVGHVERFSGTIRRMKELVTRPLFIECERITPYRGRGTDVDVILDLMIHDLDHVMEMFCAKPLEVDAVGVPVITPSYDIVSARLRFPNKRVASLTASRVSSKSLRKIRVFQSDSYISADCKEGEIQFVRKIESPEGDRVPQIKGESFMAPAGDPLLEEVKAFIESICRGKKPPVDGTTGLRCLKVALEVRDSIQNNLPDDLYRDFLAR